MQIYETMTPLETKTGTAVALGYFDGVHLGHREVLAATVYAARKKGLAAALFTFSLPQGGAGKGRAILSESEKRRRVAGMGIERYLCPVFSAFCALSPEQFVEDILVRCFDARQVFCGDNFTFGVHKSGNVALLQTLCVARGIALHIVPMAQYEDAIVSSTRVRRCLAEGEMACANALLGEPYLLDLPVRHGKKIGTTLGFPTLNQVYPPQMLVPKSGVYLTRTFVGDTWRPSATGLGTRPTVGGGDVTCETFIPAFSGTLYGEAIPVQFLQYYKPTVKFDTLEQLRAYIGDAAEAALRYPHVHGNQV